MVDEAQDFSPSWLTQLAQLLDPDGPRRLLIVADPAQELYVRGFRIPSTDDGWTRCDLVSNCRNGHEIGAILRRSLGGAAGAGLGTRGARYVPSGSMTPTTSSPPSTRRSARLALDEELAPDRIAVLTVTSRLRDLLVDRLGLKRWEDRADGIVCENVHRVKGLEFDTVVLVVDTDVVADDLLYTGISRAVSELVVVAPDAVRKRLRLD